MTFHLFSKVELHFETICIDTFRPFLTGSVCTSGCFTDMFVGIRYLEGVMQMIGFRFVEGMKDNAKRRGNWYYL